MHTSNVINHVTAVGAGGTLMLSVIPSAVSDAVIIGVLTLIGQAINAYIQYLQTKQNKPADNEKTD